MHFVSRSMLALATALLFAGATHAADYTISLKDNQFTPSDLVIPADKKVSIVVKNLGTAPAEFESHSLKREKVINGGGSAKIVVGPLKPGVYSYVDEFNEDKAKGTITVK